MITVCDISGMGGREKGGYEWGCQVVCARALRFLGKLTDQEAPQFHSYKNIVGVLSAENPAARELDNYILAHPLLREYGLTGAMHQFGVVHALKIHELGREEYLRQLRESREESDFYQFNEADALTPEEATSSTAGRG